MVTKRQVDKAWNRHFRTESYPSLKRFKKLEKKWERKTGKKYTIPQLRRRRRRRR